jgi:zinc transport system substrate-binding protein
MKLKIIPLLVVLIVGLSIFVSGCTNSGDSGNNEATGQEAPVSGAEEPITVAVSVVPQAEFVEKVGGDKVKTVVITPPGADPHTYEPSPKEVEEISKASMLVTVGVGMPFEEVWIDRFDSMNSGTLVVNCSKGLELKELEEHDHEGEEEEEHDEEIETEHENESTEEHENESDGEHEELDPHIWTSPANAKIMVEDIYEGLVELDPENEAYYAQNKDAYLEELDALDSRIREKLNGSEGSSFMVYHPSWGYFAADYGLNMISVEIEGKEPSAQDLTKIVDLAKEKNVKVIFVQAQFSTRSAEVLAQEIGGEVVAVDPLAKDYVANMDNVTDIFARNLV